MKIAGLSALLCALAAPCLAEDRESPETIVSLVVRREGYKCEKPIKATHELEDSVPEEMAFSISAES